MPRSVDERIARYEYGVNADRIKEDIVAHKPAMVDKAKTTFSNLAVLEDRVKGVLGGESVLTADYLKYHNFSRQVWKLVQRFGGGSAVIDETATLLAKWKARGCTEAVLIKIRDDVFAIPGPTGP